MSILSNFDIDKLCKKLKIPLVGVFSKDELPAQRQAGFYIVNMQSSVDEFGNDLSGTHWVGFGIFTNGESFYFDSFGVVPPQEVENYLKPFKPVPYNNLEIQAITSTDCGWWCVGVCHFIYNQKGKIKDRLEANDSLTCLTIQILN